MHLDPTRAITSYAAEVDTIEAWREMILRNPEEVFVVRFMGGKQLKGHVQLADYGISMTPKKYLAPGERENTAVNYGWNVIKEQ